MENEKSQSRLKKFFITVASLLFDEFFMLLFVLIIGLVIGSVFLLTGIIR